MTECEKLIVDNLIEEKVIIMFYARYVDDTLLIIKKKDISYVLNQFNNFDKNLKFTIRTFENSVPHFLDIEICPNGLVIYHKHNQTGQYVHLPPIHCEDEKLLGSAKKICCLEWLPTKCCKWHNKTCTTQ